MFYVHPEPWGNGILFDFRIFFRKGLVKNHQADWEGVVVSFYNMVYFIGCFFFFFGHSPPTKQRVFSQVSHALP